VPISGLYWSLFSNVPSASTHTLECVCVSARTQRHKKKITVMGISCLDRSLLASFRDFFAVSIGVCLQGGEDA